jgi:hypothetical protein
MADGERTGLRFGFGIAGLLSAALAYFAFDFGLFRGPAWRGSVVAILIGLVSAGLLLAVDRMMSPPRGAPRKRGPVKIKGPWGCPECGAAYRSDVTTCSDCHVPLVRREG